VADLAREVGAPTEDVRLAVSEAVGNAVSHAFRGTSPGTVRLRAEVRGRKLIITVSDDGTGMRPNPDTKGMGMGIPLITKLALDARFDSTEGGTTVSMSFPAENAR
jgi:serine/threonine-protein kinase RsbW/stage II sporulation protein AB (anti-sigma F factor)